MITCKEIEHFDNFGDSIIFWCVAENIPKKYITNAITAVKQKPGAIYRIVLVHV